MMKNEKHLKQQKKPQKSIFALQKYILFSTKNDKGICQKVLNVE